MWFNVQQFEEPYRIMFDVSQSKHWRPFFGRSSKNKFTTIQPERLVFIPTDERDRVDLERKIELEIKAKLRQWRGYRTCRFSSGYITSKLRDLLRAMEK